jgi:amino acid adenylation domain-containing protein
MTSTTGNIETAYPLSPLQQGMLFHSLGAPGSAVYVIQVRCEVRGALRIDAFYQAWQRVLDRHQALRAAFVWEGVDQPMQVIGRRVRLPFHYHDWRGMPEAAQQRRLDRWMERDRAGGFTLSRAPLMRVLLVRLDADRYEIVWTYHHLVCDGWSRPILLGEFWRCYAAFSAGHPVQLAPPRPYSQYIAKLPRDLSQAERFWRAELGDVTNPTPLGIDRPATARVAPQGYGRREAYLSEAETVGLDGWSRRHAVSLGTMVAAAWALVLSRYSHERDVLFGVTVSGRSSSQEGVESLVGLCINTLPLRVRVRSAEPVVSWLRGVQAKYAELREYEHSPLARIQKWTSVPSGRPLFESIVVYENFPTEAGIGPRTAAAANLAIDNVRGFDKTNFPLTLIASPGRRFSLVATYDPARFDEASVDRLLAHVATVLRRVTAGDEETVGDISLLTPAEREQIVTTWNATAETWADARSTSLVTWLEAQAAETPDAMAVWSEESSWTYAELHARANQIARRLRRLGVDQRSKVKGQRSKVKGQRSNEFRVGVWLPRSPHMVAALIGVLKAGGAYVPLDPSYPAARLAFQVTDAQVAVVLTSAACAEAVPPGPYVVDVLDSPDAAWRHESTDAPDVEISPEQLAYVIYTSGSTGQPKGAMNSHRGIGNRLAWMQKTYVLTAADRVLQKTSSSFDVSVWELFLPLGTGATLVVARPGGQNDPAYLADVIQRAGVTVLHFVPAMLDAFVTSGGLSACERVRLVVCSGEGLPGPLAARCLAGWPGRLENLYGPTEAAVDVTWQPCTPDATAQAVVPIGRPVANTQVYVGDTAGQPAPVGVVGELYLGGVQVGRGYWDRPDLTASRFVPDPFGATPGARLYRTGDLARYRADGAIEYVGRVDSQVKLHGNRIELGEIEAALRQQDDIRDAAVLLREDAPGARRLVAYVVPASPDARPTTETLQNRLRAKLPEYMVPAVIVPLDSLPLSPNGKVDRRTLPAPSGERPALTETYTAPRTTVEATLAQIWAEVLRVDRVGIHDNFFALGGDSMRTIQVQAKAREHRLAVSIEQLMRHQTIHDLAQQLAPSDADSPALTRPFDLISPEDRADLPADVEDAYPLTELQAGMLFHSELSPQSSVYHDALTFHLRVAYDAAAFGTALADVMAAHPVLRTSIHMGGYTEALQLVHRDVTSPLRVYDLRNVPQDEQDGLLAAWFDEERRNRFDWTRPPLFRLHVHRRTEHTLQATLLCHHAILDGWSVASFLTELFTAYLAHLGVAKVSVAARPKTTFREYVALERAAVQDTEARDYWTRHLADSSPTVVPRWPLRASDRDAASFTSRTAVLPAQVVSGLTRAAERARVPLKTILLAVHMRVLGFVANERDVVTGVVTHGRAGGVDADRVLGLFLNTPPLRCAIDGSWIDLARRVFDVECQHARHRHFPMSTLQRQMGGQPLFDAAFNFMHFHVYQALVGVEHLEVIDGGSRTDTNFPLLTHCTLHASTNEIEIRLDANRSHFGNDQLQRLLEYYERAYAALAADPDAACIDAVLMSPAEGEQIVAVWNQTQTAARLDRPVHDLIAHHAYTTPDAIALVDGVRELTYAQFWDRAGALAAVLQRLGVVPDTCVGLCLPRSVEMAVAVLATLRAGGAYVPFDPAYPDERLALMAEDSALRVLLTTRELAPRFARLSTRIVCLDDVLHDGDAAPAVRVDPSHLAYVMYTSGSTGRPKGIGLPHRCLTNLIEWHLQTLGGGARTLQFASLSFDASFHEMAAAWCSGGTLYLVPEAIRADSQALARTIRDQAIEKVILPPVVLQQLAEHCAHTPALFSSLRQIITTGEQLRLTPPVVDLLVALPACSLHNHYGPAETHVVTALELAGAPSSWPVHPPIGRPIANTQIYLLDRRMRPVPVGTPGELFIGGVSLARGYYNRPELTAARFVPDPIGNEPGGRLYRTGDLARWLPNGDIEYLGRIDHQVKIRGYRIELSEVEAAIGRHPAVRDAIVLAREYGPGDRRLVAYVIPSGAAAPTTTELRAFVGWILPEFMLPAAFVILDAFPLTPNGKIDRRALPAPQAGVRPDLASAFVAPRTPSEELLASIYARVLRVDRVGVEDSFFERGGHSLLATQAIVRVREAFGLDVPLLSLFERPTVAGMAAALGDMLEDRATLDEIALAVIEVEALSDEEVQLRLAGDSAPA